MMIVVERTFETVLDVVDLGEPVDHRGVAWKPEAMGDTDRNSDDVLERRNRDDGRGPDGRGVGAKVVKRQLERSVCRSHQVLMMQVAVHGITQRLKIGLKPFVVVMVKRFSLHLIH